MTTVSALVEQNRVNGAAKKAELSQSDYERFQSLILNRTGMFFGPRRHSALAHGVLSMAHNAGSENLDDYYVLLSCTETDSPIWEDLIDEITVGETYFFRDPSQLHVLRVHILPELVSRHRHDRRLRIWSAGCASGEEPYTIAILLAEMLPDAHRWNIVILATDINKRVIQRAQKGIFREWSFRRTDPAARSRYFREKEHGFELIPRVKAMVTFGYLNLSEECYPSLTTNTNAMDLILCRNVAIYQSEAVVKGVAERFHSCLMPGGWLMVGAAETSIPAYGQFAARSFSGTTVFQKISEPIPTPIRPPIKREVAPAPEQTLGLPVRPAPSPSVQLQNVPDRVMDQAQSIGQKETTPPEIEDPTGMYEEGLKLLAERRFQEALTAFQTCVAMDATYTRALYQLGQVHANLGRLDEAQSWCLQAIDQDSLMVEAHYTLALVHQEKGEHEEAVCCLKKALFLWSDFVLGHFSLCVLYNRMGKKEQSERHRQQAVKLSSQLGPDTVLPGSDDLTAGQMLTMARAIT